MELTAQQLQDLILAVDCWKQHFNSEEAEEIVNQAADRMPDITESSLRNGVKDIDYQLAALKKTRQMRSVILTHKLSLMKLQAEGQSYAY